MKELKTISMGGLGDSFIIFLKLRQLLEKDKSIEKINHLFVESNQNTLDLIKEWLYVDECFDGDGFEFEFEFDRFYERSYRSGKWSGRQPLNTAVDGNYLFPSPDGISIEDAFIDWKLDEVYDVCIQCSAGVNSNRNWKFGPLKLAELLRNKNKKVAIIGSDVRYKNDEDENNFVCKTTLRESMGIVGQSKCYVGLSGFHSYWSMASRIPNVHLEESDEHNNHYIHPDWNDFRYGIKIGTLQEVIQGLRKWGMI